MKTALCLMVSSFVFGFNATAQKPDSASALQSIVDTERAFARTSEERGIRESFLAYIAEDGILFRPGAVNGKKWMLEHPVPPSEKRPLLAWQPAYADVAQAGDLGYTFGPWQFKEDIKDEKPVGYGHFITVWKKQADGSWKFAVDLGISHAEPRGPITSWHVPANYKAKSWKSPGKRNVDSARASLMSRDSKFSNASAKQGPVKAYVSYSAKDVRLFRNDSYPFAGIDASSQALAAKIPATDLFIWQPLSADVSQSGDLGYTHGTYSVGSKQPEKITERGSYVRIWKKQNGVWKVVVDVTNPLPPSSQSGT